MTSSAVVDDAKTALRLAAVARRDALPINMREAAALAIAAQEFPLSITSGVIVSGFMPMRSEIDPLPLMRKLARAGARLALPVVAGRGRPLIMQAWQEDEPLAAGQWGLREPGPAAAEVEPDIVLVPLLAFDRAGHRIGYGAGYYDLTLARLRARKAVTAIGIAFSVQEVPAIPKTPRDEPLDFVLTEREVIEIKGPSP